ncbi:MAG: hypothetical protein LUG16_07085 [Candidatus Gastranaerophilales bacterium]|nr:hypothetical protein [Candidatus Gastranaerophilales bacterium]
MKKIITLCLAVFTIVFSSPAFAEFTQEEKDEIYDELINGYFKGTEMSLNAMPYSQESKNNFITKFKGNFNRQDFINKTWPCFSKYSKTDIYSNPNATLECSKDYLLNYSTSQQALYQELIQKN